MSQLAQFYFNLFRCLYHFTAIRLLVLFSFALALTWLISNGDVTAEVLFQSPTSPVEFQPSDTQFFPGEGSPQITVVEEEFIPEEPPVEQEFIPEEAAPVEPEVAPEEAAPVEPEVAPEEVAPVEPEVAPEEAAPVEEQAAPAQPVEAPSTAPEQQPVAPAEPAPPEPAPSSRRGEDRFAEDEFEEDDASLILDRAELIDSVVVSTAYVWLCCGIIIFLLIPLAFLFLQIRGRTRMSREDIY